MMVRPRTLPIRNDMDFETICCDIAKEIYCDFEAQKYGRYFVTTDYGILRHSNAISRRLGTLYIVRPTAFLEVLRNEIGK